MSGVDRRTFLSDIDRQLSTEGQKLIRAVLDVPGKDLSTLDAEMVKMIFNSVPRFCAILNRLYPADEYKQVSLVLVRHLTELFDELTKVAACFIERADP
jgi:hypothetical protein